MIRRDEPTTSFYEDRGLPTPRAELVPEDAAELRELVVEAGDGVPPRLLIGDGQHLREAVMGARDFEVIRTGRCKQVLSVDRESRIVRVEAGISWHGLRDELAERGLSLERFRLYPATATIGGLLSRRDAWGGRAIHDGDLRSACCALSAASPRAADYRYISAPRKASGPDLRHLFIGGEGLLGAILDATVAVWGPSAGRLYRWEFGEVSEAVATVARLHDLGAHPSWSQLRASKASASLQVAVHGPERLLARLDRVLADEIPPVETGDAEAVAEARHRLEASHPDRRSLKRSRRTLEIVLRLHDLPWALAALPDAVESVEVWDINRHRGRVFVRYRAGGEGRSRPELPAEVSARALSVRPLLDDVAVHWPQWAQALKTALDPDHTLATGP